MKELGAILLAGGRSSRMGRDKAALAVNGVSLLGRLVTLLTPRVAQIIVMFSSNQSPPADLAIDSPHLAVGRDRVPHQGPLNGIAGAMAMLEPDIDPVYVLSCDLPYLTGDWIDRLVDGLTPDVDIVVTRYQGVFNPLIALYRRRVLLEAPDLVASGRSSCLALLDGRRLNPISPPSGSLLTKDVNTPQEFEAARKRLET